MMAEQRQFALSAQHGIRRRLVTGWLSKAMGLALTVGEQILLVPVFLIFWGPERYGDWLVLLSAAGFVGLLDTGLQAYYANAMQAAMARGEPAVFRRLLHQGAALYGAIICAALPIVAIGAYGAPWTDWLNLKETAAGPAADVLVILAMNFLIGIPFGMANAVYRAHGHFATSIMVGNLARLALVCTVALSLWAGAGMMTLCIVYLAVTVAGWAGMIAHQGRRYPDLRYGVSWPDRAALRDLFAVAPLYAVAPTAMVVTTHATILMISTLAAAGQAVVMYTTMRTLTGVARMVMDQIMHVTGVEIARQFAENDHAALTTLYNFIARLAGGTCGALAGLVAVIGPPFLAIWTVGRVPFDGAVFWPLLAAAGLAGPSIAGLSVLLFINRPGGMARAYAIAAGATICLCLVLIPSLGAPGAAWAVLIAETCILSVIIPARTAKIVGGSPGRLVAHIQGVAAAGFAISGAGAWLALATTGGDSLALLVMAGALWAALAGAPLYYLMLNKPRRQWIADRLHEGLSR